MLIPENIELGADNFSQEIIEKIEEYISDKITDCDFLLIHYSILERMYESSIDKINNKLDKWSSKTRVVITSGQRQTAGFAE